MLDCSGRASFPDGLPLAHNIRMITVIYFARLREALGKSSEQLALPAGVRDLAGLRALLIERGGAWAVELAGSNPCARQSIRTWRRTTRVSPTAMK